MPKTRREHIDWCKGRALEYIELGNAQQAQSSMLSDLMKHEDALPAGPEGIALIQMGHMALTSSEPLVEVKRWIEGF